MKILTLLCAFVLASGCSPLPSKANRDAYFKGAHGKYSFDLSGVKGTRFYYIFKEAEPKVNKILQSECFRNYMTEVPAEIDLFQDAYGKAFPFIKKEIHNLKDAHRYVVSQTVEVYISVEEMPENTAAQGGPGRLKFGEEVIDQGEDILMMTIIHELMHAIGFSHEKNEDPKRFMSLPYHAEWAAFICRSEGKM